MSDKPCSSKFLCSPPPGRYPCPCHNYNISEYCNHPTAPCQIYKKTYIFNHPTIRRTSVPILSSSRPPSRGDSARSDADAQDRARAGFKRSSQQHGRSQSTPSRPPTRRNPADMPIGTPFVPRSRSTEPHVRGPHTIRHSNLPIQIDDSTKEKSKSKKKSKEPPSENVSKPGYPGPDYLQFALRITEDIIRNDLYAIEEMKRVFSSHIAANRDRLELDKMLEQIDELCKQLNIPHYEYISERQDRTEKIKRSGASPLGSISLSENGKIQDHSLVGQTPGSLVYRATICRESWEQREIRDCLLSEKRENAPLPMTPEKERIVPEAGNERMGASIINNESPNYATKSPHTYSISVCDCGIACSGMECMVTNTNPYFCIVGADVQDFPNDSTCPVLTQFRVNNNNVQTFIPGICSHIERVLSDELGVRVAPVNNGAQGNGRTARNLTKSINKPIERQSIDLHDKDFPIYYPNYEIYDESESFYDKDSQEVLNSIAVDEISLRREILLSMADMIDCKYNASGGCPNNCNEETQCITKVANGLECVAEVTEPNSSNDLLLVGDKDNAEFHGMCTRPGSSQDKEDVLADDPPNSNSKGNDNCCVNSDKAKNFICMDDNTIKIPKTDLIIMTKETEQETILLKESGDKETEYIMIKGPVYILKSTLQPDLVRTLKSSAIELGGIPTRDMNSNTLVKDKVPAKNKNKSVPSNNPNGPHKSNNKDEKKSEKHTETIEKGKLPGGNPKAAGANKQSIHSKSNSNPKPDATNKANRKNSPKRKNNDDIVNNDEKCLLEINNPKSIEAKDINNPKSVEVKKINNPMSTDSKEIYNPKPIGEEICNESDLDELVIGPSFGCLETVDDDMSVMTACTRTEVENPQIEILEMTNEVFEEVKVIDVDTDTSHSRSEELFELSKEEISQKSIEHVQAEEECVNINIDDIKQEEIPLDNQDSALLYDLYEDKFQNNNFIPTTFSRQSLGCLEPVTENEKISEESTESLDLPINSSGTAVNMVERCTGLEEPIQNLSDTGVDTALKEAGVEPVIIEQPQSSIKEVLPVVSEKNYVQVKMVNQSTSHQSNLGSGLNNKRKVSIQHPLHVEPEPSVPSTSGTAPSGRCIRPTACQFRPAKLASPAQQPQNVQSTVPVHAVPMGPGFLVLTNEGPNGYEQVVYGITPKPSSGVGTSDVQSIAFIPQYAYNPEVFMKIQELIMKDAKLNKVETPEKPEEPEEPEVVKEVIKPVDSPESIKSRTFSSALRSVEKGLKLLSCKEEKPFEEAIKSYEKALDLTPEKEKEDLGVMKDQMVTTILKVGARPMKHLERKDAMVGSDSAIGTESLLLTDEYDINLSDISNLTYEGDALPYPLSHFYPTIATQVSSDSLLRAREADSSATVQTLDTEDDIFHPVSLLEPIYEKPKLNNIQEEDLGSLKEKKVQPHQASSVATVVKESLIGLVNESDQFSLDTTDKPVNPARINEQINKTPPTKTPVKKNDVPSTSHEKASSKPRDVSEKSKDHQPKEEKEVKAVALPKKKKKKKTTKGIIKTDQLDLDAPEEQEIDPVRMKSIQESMMKFQRSKNRSFAKLDHQPSESSLKEIMRKTDSLIKVEPSVPGLLETPAEPEEDAAPIIEPERKSKEKDDKDIDTYNAEEEADVKAKRESEKSVLRSSSIINKQQKILPREKSILKNALLKADSNVLRQVRAPEKQRENGLAPPPPLAPEREFDYFSEDELRGLEKINYPPEEEPEDEEDFRPKIVEIKEKEKLREEPFALGKSEPKNSIEKILDKLNEVTELEESYSMTAQVAVVTKKMDQFREFGDIQEHALKEVLEEELDDGTTIPFELIPVQREYVRIDHLQGQLSHKTSSKGKIHSRDEESSFNRLTRLGSAKQLNREQLIANPTKNLGSSPSIERH